MKRCWQTKKLGDLAKIELGKTPARASASLWDEKKETDNVWLSIADLLNVQGAVVVDSKEYISDKGAALCKVVPKGTLLVSFKLTLGRLAFAGRDLYTNEAIAALTLFNERELSKEYLFWFLQFFDWQKAAEGDIKIKGMTLNKAKLKELAIYFPPLPEQQRIVGILDKAFDGIANARANAEQNLRNARALFESHLNEVFARRGEGWMDMTVDKISTNLDSKRIPITKSARKSGKYPYYGASGIVDYVADYIFDGDALLVSEDGANLLARSTPIAFSVSGKYWVNNHAHILKFENMATQRFVEFYLESIRLDKYITGAAQPKLNQQALNSIPIPIPKTIAAQARIVKDIESLASESQRLESLYQRKLVALDELKKSLLHQAFSGKLTEQLRPSMVIAFPEKVQNISPIDLHAGVLAIAYRLHEKSGKTKHFGHVKAEKIAHMIEAHAGVDLGRAPVKDAAGPNDYPHLKRVEHRAKKAGFFDFQRAKNAGYRVTKYRQFESLIERTRERLGDRNRDVDSIVELMLPMETRQAEIFCTVYAAWNNLLLDRQLPVDEDIVREARENWHPDKLAIPREKFFAAIDWMRKKGITPTGKGKKVSPKAGKK